MDTTVIQRSTRTNHANRRTLQLVKILRSSKVKERVEAAQTLGHHRNKQSFSALADALNDSHYKVRLTAVESLGELGSTRSVTALMEALDDKNPEVRMRTAEQLGVLKAVAAAEKLISLLRKSHDPLLLVHVAESLGSIKVKNAVPALTRKLKDRDPLVRGYSADALGKIGEEKSLLAIEAVLKKEKSEWVKIWLYATLYRLGRRETLAQVARGLYSKQYRVRCAAASVLADIVTQPDKRRAAEYLREALGREQTIAARSSIKNALTLLRSGSRRVKSSAQHVASH